MVATEAASAPALGPLKPLPPVQPRAAGGGGGRAGKLNGADKTVESAFQARGPLHGEGMEVTVMQAMDVPSMPVLAVRAGLARRQGKLELEKPFMVARPNSENRTVEVTLFQQLASETLPGGPEVLCSLPVRRPDGAASEVKLRIRRGACAAEANPQQAGAAAKEYLDKHQLQQRIQDMIQEVLHEQPRDPYRYMLERLRKVKAAQAPEAPAPTPAPAPRTRPGRDLVRASLMSVFHSPVCSALANASVQEAVHRDTARQMAADAVGGYPRGAIQEAAPEAPLREQARSVVRFTLSNSSGLLAPDYQRSVVRWTLQNAMRGATHSILGYPEAGEGAQAGASAALPTPIVSLGGTENSWGQWLSGPMMQNQESF